MKFYKIIYFFAFLFLFTAAIAQASQADESDIISELMAGTDIDSVNIGPLFLPSQSDTESDTLALQLLGLCSGFNENNTKLLAKSAGLTTIINVNYDKAASDADHTCAFTLAEGSVLKGLRKETAIVIIIRGTDSGEWYSNFDFCPSHSSNAIFSENFLFTAEDVFNTFTQFYDKSKYDNVIICGHSRGAACANLLGMLVNSFIGNNNVYVYTFATPETIHSDFKPADCDNIFNFINPCDMVPSLPLPQWDFSRAGQDIFLSVNDEIIQNKVSYILDTLYKTAPSIQSYYLDRHSLNHAGIDEDGITSFEFMLMLISSIMDSSNISSAEDIYTFYSQTEEASSENSDFQPLINIIQELLDNDFALGKSILLQHLPTTYKELIIKHANEK